MKIMAFIGVLNDTHLNIQRRFYDEKYIAPAEGANIEHKTRTIHLNEHEITIDSSHMHTLGIEGGKTLSDGFIICINPNNKNTTDTAEAEIRALKSGIFTNDKPVILALQQHPAAEELAHTLSEKHKLPVLIVDPSLDNQEIFALFAEITSRCIPEIIAREEKKANTVTISKPKPSGLFSHFSRKNSSPVETLEKIWANTETTNEDNREKILAVLSNYTTKGGLKRHHMDDIKALCATAKASNATAETIMSLLQGMVEKKIFSAHSELKRHIEFINAKSEKEKRIQFKK